MCHSYSAAMTVQMHWTPAAQDCARRHGVEAAAQALQLPPAVQIDDLVELQGPQGAVTFIVRRRCWQQSPQGQLQLRVDIDHPPRPSGLG